VSSESLPASPLRPSCAACRIKMRLVAVDPHPEFGNAFEVHGFACTGCGRMQNYTLRRQSMSNRPATPSDADRRQSRSRR
jgi:hypothetical protein